MGGWGAAGGLNKHLNTNGSAVPSVGDPDSHNSQGRPGLPLQSFWHPKQLINAPQGLYRP